MTSSPYPHSDREIIRLIDRSPQHRAGYKQLIRELGLGGGRERRLLLETTIMGQFRACISASMGSRF